MTARPTIPTWAGQNNWYAFGWQVNTNGHWWHTGALNGTRTFMARVNYKGLAWVVMTNTWPYKDDNAFISAIDNGMWTQAQAVTTWPTHDLFGLLTATDDAPAAPTGLALSAAPNPTRSAATVTLKLDIALSASVVVFDVLGREVMRLHDGPLGDGVHTFHLDARLPAGMYVIRVETPQGSASRRLTVAL